MISSIKLKTKITELFEIVLYLGKPVKQNMKKLNA